MAVVQPKLPNQPHNTQPVLLANNQLTQPYAALFRDMLDYIKALEARLTEAGL